MRNIPKARVVQMGPAGENLVRYACVTSDLKNFHGRGGLGAVMGSKNLRAIVVKGSNREIKLANPEGLKKIREWFNSNLKTHPAISLHHELGTAKGIVPVSVAGILPTYNFQDGSFADAENICGETMKRELNGKTETCYACGVSCKRSVEGKSDKFVVTRQYGGPEYESIGLLGSNLGVNSILPIAALNQHCNALGLDTISTGATLSWAIECFERGLLSTQDTKGIELKWNDPETYMDLLDAIAHRTGFGEASWRGEQERPRSRSDEAQKDMQSRSRDKSPRIMNLEGSGE
jgi:aldehyde:ferredoxin oxidoreductase